jgi:predicted N-acyltransferase
MERLRVVESLAGVPAAQWNALAEGNPFVSHEFLSALIDTGCASRRTGWQPQIILLEKENSLSGAMPLFLKSHSRGEYVFDWAWPTPITAMDCSITRSSCAPCPSRR